MIQELIDLINQAVKGYVVIFEEAEMANVRVDALDRGSRVAYIEEYRTGSYTENRFGDLVKTTRIDLYFLQFCEMHEDAIVREGIREDIEITAVQPFIRVWRNKYPNADLNIATAYGIPRFDANEVSVRLTLTITDTICI